MTSPVTISILDSSNEVGQWQLNLVNLTAANLTAQQTLVANLMTATLPLIRGNEQQRSFNIPVRFAVTPPADVEAQREDKWLITYVDNTPFLDAPTNAVPNPGYGKKFTSELPTANRTGNMQAGTDIVDLTDGDWPAFITNFEATARSPYGGTPNIVQIKFVGRNN